MPPLRLIAPDPLAGGGGTIQARVPIEGPEGAAGPGLLKFADKLGDWAEHERALKRINDIADHQSGFQTELDRKRLELSTDPDIAGREAKFQEFAQAQFKTRIEGMDRDTAALFKRAANPIADAMGLSVRHLVQKDTLDKALVGLRDGNDQLVVAAGNAKNPNEREAAIAQIETSLKLALDGKVLSPAQYEAEKKATLVKVDQATGLRLIRENPAAMAQQLARTDFLPNLDPVAREHLIDKANTEVRSRASAAYTAMARADLVERRELRLKGDEAMKQIIDLNDQNKLTPQEVEARRPWLDHTTYGAAMVLLKGGTNVDDMKALVAIEPNIGERDLKPELDKAFTNRLITRQTYTSLLAKNEAALKDDQPESPFKRGRALVKEALTPGALLSGPAADIQRQALVGALREFDDFALGRGVQKLRETPGVALDHAQDIVNRYRLVNYDSIGEALGLPRFVDKPRNLITDVDLTAAGKKVLEEFDAGRLSRAERDLQLQKLEQWEQIVKDRAAALAAPKPPPRPGAAPAPTPTPGGR